MEAADVSRAVGLPEPDPVSWDLEGTTYDHDA